MFIHCHRNVYVTFRFSIADSIKYLPIRIVSDYNHSLLSTLLTDQTTWLATAGLTVMAVAVCLRQNNVRLKFSRLKSVMEE